MFVVGKAADKQKFSPLHDLADNEEGICLKEYTDIILNVDDTVSEEFQMELVEL